MVNYIVGTSTGGHVSIEADYFQMIYDGITGVDAQFFVTEDVKESLKTPPTTKNILVAYVKQPIFVQTEDNRAEPLDDDRAYL